MTEILSACRERGQAASNAHRIIRRFSRESGKVATACRATISVAGSFFLLLFSGRVFMLLLDNMIIE